MIGVVMVGGANGNVNAMLDGDRCGHEFGGISDGDGIMSGAVVVVVVVIMAVIKSLWLQKCKIDVKLENAGQILMRPSFWFFLWKWTMSKLK